MAKKVMLGMSGGVDSSVAALLLLEQGYEVTGITMKLRPDEFMRASTAGGCCSLDDIDDARRVSYKLGIDHLVLNFTEVFDEEVIKYFTKAYQNGQTPNPCIACNQKIKFDALLKKALFLGYDYISTGHYAVIEFNKSLNRWLLKRSGSAKDQSYVLYGMTQHQLAHTLMPLENMQKADARELARKYELPVAAKPDSQEICFIEDNNYAKFIEKYTSKKAQPGNFIDKNETVLGRHEGLIKYTIGQRKGLGISFGEPHYVTKIDPKQNTVTLGTEKDQYSSSALVKDLNFIAIDKLQGSIDIQAKVRYLAKPAEANIVLLGDGRVKVNFKEPQKAITPGQAIVFYDGDIVAGGGTIDL